MREEIQCWNSDVVSIHNDLMYSELIHEHHLNNRTLKLVTFEEEKGMGAARGYFATKDYGTYEVKYFIPEEHRKHMPIKYKQDGLKEVTYKTGGNSADIIKKPFAHTKPIAFRIKPEDTISTRELFDEFTWGHSCSPHWLLNLFMAVAGFGSRTYIGVCSESEFGKSSSYDLIHALTDQSLVFKPRSVPGLIHAITETGNMVFDEMHDTTKEVKKLIEEFSLDAGGRKPYYQNGALKSKGLKQRYSLINQSITFLFNTLDQYDSPSSFFEHLWANPVAMDKRFVKVLLKGQLEEDFHMQEGLHLKDIALANRDKYIQFTKKLFHIQECYMQNKFVRKYQYQLNDPPVRGRKIHTYNAVTMMIDQWAESISEYIAMVEVFNKAIKSYQDMISNKPFEVKEERIR